MMYSKDKKIAIIPPNRIGDCLLMSVFAHNLYKNNYDVTFFSNPLITLYPWFPNLKMSPLSSDFEEARKVLEPFDVLIYQHPSKLSQEGKWPHQEVMVLHRSPFFMTRKSLIDVSIDVCQNILKLPVIERHNGMVVPQNLEYRKYPKRVLVHPSSLRPEKVWPQEKFVALAEELMALGYEPVFTVSPQEKPDWVWLLKKGFQFVCFDKLSELASYIYESGYMVGNDSGVAHLASNVGIPTLVLFIRPGVAKRWRPNFYPGRVVLPWPHLPGPKLKEMFWKKLVGVSKVKREFVQLVKETERVLST